MRKIFFIAFFVLFGSEIFFRLALGLGTPPLFQTDDALEYRLKPNQSLYRFGNYFETNEHGMRSPGIAGETRSIVLVLGDSVLHGGAQISQENLATSLITDDKTVYANFSAPSWGPANILAALRESEDIDMQSIVVVLNSDDLTDVPSFSPLSKDQPESNPFFAVWEAATRYLPRYFNFFKGNNFPEVSSDLPIKQGRDELAALLNYLKRSVAPACVVLHPKLSEITSAGSEQYLILRDILERNGVQHVKVTDLIQGDSSQYYLDDIHLSDLGQIWLGNSISKCSNELIKVLDRGNG